MAQQGAPQQAVSLEAVLIYLLLPRAVVFSFALLAVSPIGLPHRRTVPCHIRWWPAYRPSNPRISPTSACSRRKIASAEPLNVTTGTAYERCLTPHTLKD